MYRKSVGVASWFKTGTTVGDPVVGDGLVRRGSREEGGGVFTSSTEYSATPR